MPLNICLMRVARDESDISTPSSKPGVCLVNDHSSIDLAFPSTGILLVAVLTEDGKEIPKVVQKKSPILHQKWG